MKTTGRSVPRRRGGGVGNLIGGFVAGLYSVPEGIGYASLAGINPMLGIYAGMVPVAVAAAFTGSVLLMSTLTSAIALTMGGILDDAGYAAAQVPQAVVTMALLAGLIMVALGALRLGSIVNCVSNAVMTGFVMGVAILIMVGKVADIFGYDPAGFSNKVVKAIDIVAHPGPWERTGLLEMLGTENVLPPDPHLGASLEQGRARARELLAELEANANTPSASHREVPHDGTSDTSEPQEGDPRRD